MLPISELSSRDEYPSTPTFFLGGFAAKISASVGTYFGILLASVQPQPQQQPPPSLSL
jgi:hypothetical protein